MKQNPARKRPAAAVVFLGALVAIGCLDDARPAGNGESATRAATCVVVEQSAAGASEAERAAAIEVARRYRDERGECPSLAQLEELRLIWLENAAGWNEFPAQADRFFRSNFSGDGLDEIRALVGMRFESARAKLVNDPDQPMTASVAPRQVGSMTLHEFSEGMSLYLVVVREGVVTGVYFFDQI